MADLVVLDGDPLTCPEKNLKDLPIEMTIVGGTVVFERSAAGAANCVAPRRPAS
jgi:predicted amidohydrolase YtcJ